MRSSSVFNKGSSIAALAWKAEDIIYAESVNPQTRISPDAKWLVWVKSSGDKEKDARVSDLMSSSRTENKEIQLIRGSDNNGQPQSSPDSQVGGVHSLRSGVTDLLEPARPDWLLWHVGAAK